MKRLIWIISFFLFSGYYVGLNIIFYLNLSNFSRFYSIPVRLLLSSLMIFIIIKNFKMRRNKNIIFFLFFLFSILYILKILYTQAILNNVEDLSRNWMEYIFYFISFVFLPFYTFASVDFKVHKKTIIDSLIFSGFLLGLSTIIIFWDLIASGGIGRLNLLTYETGESTISPLALSYSGALTLTLCIYILIFEKSSRKHVVYLLLTILFSAVIFFLGASRGSLVALILSVPIFLYFSSNKYRIKIYFIIFLSIPLLIYGAEKLGSSIFDRSFDSIQTGDTSGREGLWSNAITEFIENPVLGGRIEVAGLYPHNIFLEVLMATGIVGFLLFLLIFFNSLKRSLKLIKLDSIYLLALILFVHGFSQHMFTGALWSAILVFVSLGLMNYNVKQKYEIK